MYDGLSCGPDLLSGVIGRVTGRAASVRAGRVGKSRVTGFKEKKQEQEAEFEEEMAIVSVQEVDVASSSQSNQ